jgi:hypothetical protein
MNTQAGPGAHAVATPWSGDKRRALLALRMRYQQAGDLFTTAELVRLQFLRWLYRTGQLVP